MDMASGRRCPRQSPRDLGTKLEDGSIRQGGRRMNRITRINLLAKTKEELVDLIARILEEGWEAE